MCSSDLVTGTEDLLMAAVLARGETVLDNAAREPEVSDLAALLTRMGARIQGAGTSTIRIQGVERLAGADHTIIPDRIEAGTYMIAAAITGGEVELVGARRDLVGAVAEVLGQAGVAIAETARGLSVRRANGLVAGTDVMTEPFPGFPTDLQA